MQPLVSLNDPEFLKDRRRSYRGLRTNTPVAVTELDGEKAIVLTRYQDVDKVTKSPESVVQPAAGHFPSNIGNGPSADFYKRSLPSIDHPLHSELRRIISPVFMPQSIATMEQWVIEVVERELDSIAEMPVVEVVSQLAHRIAVGVICKVLHVPEEDGDLLTNKVGDLVQIFSQGSLTEAILDKTNEAAIELADYLGALLERLPDLPETDFMGALIAAEHTGAIDHEECVALATDVLLGNYHTTVVSITNAVHAFALFPEQHRMLAENPDLAARAWEEVLRFEAPVHFRLRYVSAPMSIGDFNIDPGVRLLLGFASANWDETVFENPDSFIISRKPIRHFAFGSGRHFCLGAPLSRLEGRIILPRFLSRFPNYRLVDPPPARNEDLTFPSIERLFIALGRSD
jgi:cytochrome P450